MFPCASFPATVFEYQPGDNTLRQILTKLWRQDFFQYSVFYKGAKLNLMEYSSLKTQILHADGIEDVARYTAPTVLRRFLIRINDCLYLPRQCRDNILRNVPDDIVVYSHIIVDKFVAHPCHLTP